MVVLEQCRIDQDGKCLIIEAVVENLSYYKDVYIDSIIIDTDNTYSPNGPSSNPVFSMTFSENSEKDVDINYHEDNAGIKRVRLCLTSKDLNKANLNDNIFFVYVVAAGIPAPCTPCGMDNSYTMGIAINLRPVYNMAMKYINELDSSCAIPKGFIDMILRLKAFDLSLRTGNYPVAFKQWDKLFKTKVNISPNKPCGCNGIN